jgi:hypothetical protein
MTSPEDALAFSGFEKCASSREYFWHLASDREDQWDRFPDAQSWEWIPGGKCKGMNPLNPEDLVRTLVEDGGWYLVGDSVTENHFFSLSCILYPYVFATPDYTLRGDFDRAWPQNLYLKPSSPLLSTLSLPEGFDIASTPLVTFRRIDLLFSKDELISIYKSSQPEQLNTSLFSDEGLWTLPVAEYLNEFLAPLPKGNYATMVVSTAGHWTTHVFSEIEPPGMEGILSLFEVAMGRWAEEVQSALWADARINGLRLRSKRKERRAVVRAYLPGHNDCHNLRHPWDEIPSTEMYPWNWAEIPEFNAVFEKLLLSRNKFPNIHYLGIDHPARLRPDAHATGDCLHIMTGAGVLEGWSHYIWRYVTREIPER